MTNDVGRLFRVLTACALAFMAAAVLAAQSPSKPRARDLGLSPIIGGVPGRLDAMTDVAGVEVGHTTLVSGEGRLQVGKGPVRTGVTVVHPRGKKSNDPVFGAWFTLNGNGEMTGTTWLQESGILEGPVAITNTHSVGVVRDAILQWQVQRPGMQPWGLPVVAETYDGDLNDINGFHVKAEHVFNALDNANSGPVAEGNVGGGTGMVCHRFKGGIGTASRVLQATEGGFTVGVLVQCNYGRRAELRVGGVPVGEEIPDLMPCASLPEAATRLGVPRCTEASPRASESPIVRKSDSQQVRSATSTTSGPSDAVGRSHDDGAGSIIIVVATDAPLLPHQLKRLATRAALGVGRMGGKGENSSGDIFVAFSTANAGAAASRRTVKVDMVPNDYLNPLFYATVQATEEAILNALLAAETMTGADGYRVYALPRDRLMAAMRKYGRLK